MIWFFTELLLFSLQRLQIFKHVGTISVAGDTLGVNCTGVTWLLPAPGSFHYSLYLPFHLPLWYYISADHKRWHSWRHWYWQIVEIVPIWFVLSQIFRLRGTFFCMWVAWNILRAWCHTKPRRGLKHFCCPFLYQMNHLSRVWIKCFVTGLRECNFSSGWERARYVFLILGRTIHWLIPHSSFTICILISNCLITDAWRSLPQVAWNTLWGNLGIQQGKVGDTD